MILDDPTVLNKVVAKELGTAERYVSRVRHNMGVPGVAGRPPKWTEDQLAFAKELLEDGAGYREASASSGVPRTTLHDKYPGMGMSASEGGTVGWKLRKLPESLRFKLIRMNGMY